MALRGMKCLNLTKETVKMLGVHFSYNNKLEHEMNFQSHIVKIESVLMLYIIIIAIIIIVIDHVCYKT